VIVVVHKLPVPMYAKIALNAVAYFLEPFAHLPYAASINRCVTLSMKEELYHAYNTESHVRYVEHLVGFVAGYSILYFAYSQIARVCSVVVMCAALCFVVFTNKIAEKNDCRCAQATSV